MGTTSAMDWNAAVQEGLVDLNAALLWHLRCNHYPPVPESMVAVCNDAIDLANEEDWNAEVLLPDGVSYRGSQYAPVWVIIEQHHLQSFIDTGEEW